MPGQRTVFPCDRNPLVPFGYNGCRVLYLLPDRCFTIRPMCHTVKRATGRRDGLSTVWASTFRRDTGDPYPNVNAPGCLIFRK